MNLELNVFHNADRDRAIVEASFDGAVMTLVLTLGQATSLYAKLGELLGTQKSQPAQTTVETEVRRLLAANQKFNAIKYVRSVYDMGLKEAKDFVDRIQGVAPTTPAWSVHF